MLFNIYVGYIEWFYGKITMLYGQHIAYIISDIDVWAEIYHQRIWTEYVHQNLSN